jgi:hypothetical protein
MAFLSARPRTYAQPADGRTQVVFDFVEGLDLLGFFRNVDLSRSDGALLSVEGSTRAVSGSLDKGRNVVCEASRLFPPRRVAYALVDQQFGVADAVGQ